MSDRRRSLHVSRSPILLPVLAACLGAAATVLGADESSAPAPRRAERILKTADVRGGLVVVLGCGDGRLAGDLATRGPYLVHGLDAEAANVAKARKHLRGRGLYGKVTVERFRGERLPYVDNLVNLLVCDDLGSVPKAEVMRVLAPGGVLCVLDGGSLKTTVKPHPDAIDEWTHYLYDATNNAVSSDTAVGPPRHLQWVADPKWARSHDHLTTVTGCVMSGGRLFSIIDEGPTAAVVLPARWHLVARDAFSGVLLWKRPIPNWEWHLRGFRSGPSDIARRLVAVGDTVYVTLGYNAPVSALDAATGKTLRTYDGTEGAREIVWHDGTLLVVTGGATRGLPPADHEPAYSKPGLATVRAQRPPYPIEIPPKALMAIDADTGTVRWTKDDADTKQLMPTTVCARGEAVFFENAEAVLRLDAATGKVRWKAERPLTPNRPAWTAPTLVVWEDVVLSADRDAANAFARNAETTNGVLWVVSSGGGNAPPGKLIAFSAEDGKRLWDAPCQECYNAPVDVLVADGLVWTGELVRAKQPGITQGLDPRTGEVWRKRPPDGEFFRVGMNHHRCYRNKATSKYLVLGRAGVEFIDLETGKGDASHWTRGTCQLGVVPAGGLLYAPSHSCACYIEAKLSGFNCLAPASDSRRLPEEITAEGRLERGLAYDKPIRNPKSGIRNGDWPTYRHDAARSGRAGTPVPADLKPAWKRRLAGPLTAPVVAGGKVYVAETDAHTVHALDAATGEPAWSFTAGGRVDSPPTLWRGRVLFGSADGHVYCVRAADGELAWRFLAAPDTRRIVSYERLESAWPVHGSVLVQDGVVWCVAGRSSFTDGGLYLYRLDPATGAMHSVTHLSGRDPQTGLEQQDSVRGTGMQGALPDVLSGDGTNVFMRQVRFDAEGHQQGENVPHLFASVGFLDGSWWHRTYWMLGTAMGNGYGGWPHAGMRNPAGRLLVVDDGSVYGFGRNQYIHHGAHVGIDGATVFHFKPKRDAKHRETFYRLFASGQAETKDKRGNKRSAYETRWSRQVPCLARAMVLAGETLLLAGPPDPFRTDDPTAVLEGRKGGILAVVGAADGKVAATHDLASPPVFDGMAAARGRLYLSLTDGTVVCMGGQP
ncbi:MAG: PQQ-binding-like beta-propeller repeat protein [Phycisphaerae bacterium]